MTVEVWLSVGLGVGIGVLYGMASIATVNLAGRHRDETFMAVFFGGMMARLFLAVLIVTLVLVLVPVDAFAFLSAFLLVFVAGIALEIWLVHRGSVADGPDISRPDASPTEVEAEAGEEQEGSA